MIYSITIDTECQELGQIEPGEIIRMCNEFLLSLKCRMHAVINTLEISSVIT
jgi:hypothetical protein